MLKPLSHRFSQFLKFTLRSLCPSVLLCTTFGIPIGQILCVYSVAVMIIWLTKVHNISTVDRKLVVLGSILVALMMPRATANSSKQPKVFAAHLNEPMTVELLQILHSDCNDRNLTGARVFALILRLFDYDSLFEEAIQLNK